MRDLLEMWFEVLLLIAGIAFGYFRSGREDLATLIRQGLLFGIILGLILGILSVITPGGMSIGAGIEGAIGISVKVIILSIIFIIGVMVGDFLESWKKK